MVSCVMWFSVFRMWVIMGWFMMFMDPLSWPILLLCPPHRIIVDFLVLFDIDFFLGVEWVCTFNDGAHVGVVFI